VRPASAATGRYTRTTAHCPLTTRLATPRQPSSSPTTAATGPPGPPSPAVPTEGAVNKSAGGTGHPPISIAGPERIGIPRDAPEPPADRSAVRTYQRRHGGIRLDQHAHPRGRLLGTAAARGCPPVRRRIHL